MNRILCCCLLGLLGACVQVEPVSLDGNDRGASTTGVTRHGSGWVRPRQDWRIDDPYARVPDAPASLDWPELPLDRIERIHPYMTETELFALLGEPLREDVEVDGVDSTDNDYNATIYTWRYRDLRYGAALERDLEVRLAWVDNARSLPARPEVVGPAWVVMSHDLF